MAKIKLTTLDELNDRIWGPKGTAERDEMEAKLKEDLNVYLIGEAIKKARLANNMTQEQLGEKMGVQKAQISRIEKGKCLSLSSIRRAFCALGVTTAALDLGTLGKVALW